MDILTSDTHFGHLRMAIDRGFGGDIDAHDGAVRAIWNHNIKPDDDVYFVGDLTLRCARETVKDFVESLNGRIHVIRGNHDRGLEKYVRDHPNGKIVWMKDVHTLKYPDVQIFLSHYAHRTWPNKHHGAWHLYGHSHGTLLDDPNSLSFDIGVDCHDLRPLSIDEVRDIMSKKPCFLEQYVQRCQKHE